MSRAKESCEEFNRSDVYKRVGKQLRDELWFAMRGMELFSEEYCFICDSVLQAVESLLRAIATPLETLDSRFSLSALVWSLEALC